MSDYPERAVQVMRQELEMRLEWDDDVLEALGECTNEEVAEFDLADDDVRILRKIGADGRAALVDVAEDDAQILLDMSDQIQLLGESRYSAQRHEFHLRRNFTIAKAVGGLANALTDREAAEDIVRWINTAQNDSPETNKDYRVAFRMFSELATEGEGKPETVAWVPGGYPKNYDPAPQPEKMYKWDAHIVPMLDACHNSRDRALIALAWDLGARPSELFDLVRGRISDHKYGKQVTLYRGKQGTRSPVIIPSVPYVQEWLNDHPSDDSNAALWTQLQRPDSITNNRIRDIMKEKATAANMTPPSTPTPSQMRKSSASYLASEGVPQSHLEVHHGWRTGSKAASRYISVFGDANDREIARVHGVDIPDADETTAIAPVTCPRCDRETPRGEEFCMWCHHALSQSAVHEIKEQTRETRAALLRYVQDEPTLLEDIESAEELIRLVDDRPESLEEAEALLEAVSDD